MRLDNNLVFSEAQAVEASAVSDYTRDNGAASQAIAHPLVHEMRVDTLFVDGGSSTLTFHVQGSADDSTYVDLAISATINAADLIVGKTVRLTVPPGTPYRYRRCYYTVGGSNFTGGKVDAYAVQTVQQGLS